MKTDEILDKLPYLLADRLRSDPFFESIPIFVADDGDVKAEYNRRQAVISAKSGKIGAAVIVLQIVADDIYPGQPAGPMKLYPSFQVVTVPELNKRDNGTKKSARKISRRIVISIKGLLMIRDVIQAIKPAKPCIEPVDLKKDLGEGSVSEQVNFECQEASPEIILYAGIPMFSGEGASALVLTSNTPGADIWYTLDGSYPFPGDADDFPGSTAQLYGGPIALAAGTTRVTAGAYLEGYVPSPIESMTIVTTPK